MSDSPGIPPAQQFFENLRQKRGIGIWNEKKNKEKEKDRPIKMGRDSLKIRGFAGIALQRPPTNEGGIAASAYYVVRR